MHKTSVLQNKLVSEKNVVPGKDVGYQRYGTPPSSLHPNVFIVFGEIRTRVHRRSADDPLALSSAGREFDRRGVRPHSEGDEPHDQEGHGQNEERLRTGKDRSFVELVNIQSIHDVYVLWLDWLGPSLTSRLRYSCFGWVILVLGNFCAITDLTRNYVTVAQLK